MSFQECRYDLCTVIFKDEPPFVTAEHSSSAANVHTVVCTPHSQLPCSEPLSEARKKELWPATSGSEGKLMEGGEERGGPNGGGEGRNRNISGWEGDGMGDKLEALV